MVECLLKWEANHRQCVKVNGCHPLLLSGLLSTQVISRLLTYLEHMTSFRDSIAKYFITWSKTKPVELSIILQGQSLEDRILDRDWWILQLSGSHSQGKSSFDKHCCVGHCLRIFIIQSIQ